MAKSQNAYTSIINIKDHNAYNAHVLRFITQLLHEIHSNNPWICLQNKITDHLKNF